MSQELTLRDSLTVQTYQKNNFDTSSEDSKFSYTSARVGKPLYNTYEKNDFKVFGYYNGACQYDARLDGSEESDRAGRGRDLMNINPDAYDKIIIGFCGIVGDQGENKEAIKRAAQEFNKKDNEPTFIDSWGYLLSYCNVGFDGWLSSDVLESFSQNKCQGLLGGLRKLKEKNPNLVISLSIGGRELSQPFHELVKSSEKRTTFANGVADILKRFPMIGEIDLDWEYPGGDGGSEDPQNYAELIKKVKSTLSSNSRDDVKISIAAAGDIDKIKAANIPLLMEAGVSYIKIMTFDFFGTPWSDSLAHHTNLKSNPQDKKSYGIDVVVNYLIKELNVPSKSLFIGFAAYSRNAKNAEISSSSPLSGNCSPHEGTTIGTFESGVTEYYDILYNYLDLNSKSGKNGFSLYTDKVGDADFLYNPRSRVFMSIDTPRSVKSKGEYVVRNNLGGLFTYTIDQDHGLLLNAAREGLGNVITKKEVDMSEYYFNGR
ncbi:hypothetical protein DICPUDRAFT_91849 [Dictyostelium purpureum]|uniref:GH18 domain-containing protein n=1 Tax=Dictyostelium purpureum TaxID=5786 RepID=F0ZI71_DICPU|nr:uncharacterized protein DICPUDRAFT_91849 [Dictyostelium purpureum]EGC36369.1 hypothetical protein DICPUDRAFT_91849 [Dictyostelium purpureum]|eukprot:XP_003287123.1 hypothetical protein DICPUDRAFT_91849 [Dictyostelium purpureum]